MQKLRKDKNKTLNRIETHYKAIEPIRLDKEHSQSIRIEEQSKQPNENWFYGAEMEIVLAGWLTSPVDSNGSLWPSYLRLRIVLPWSKNLSPC